MKIKMGDSAVSEIIGSILLLAMAICVFSVVYMNVLSDEGPEPGAYVTIVGKLENDDIIFEHRRGEDLGPDTEVVLNIAGLYGDSYHMTVNDGSLIDYMRATDGWNIGERLVYHPTENLDDVQIKANIFDKETNSLVFWGTLQEGYVALPFGRGGIWHFNESYWDGTQGEAKDSSGNENHGTAYNGANTIDDSPIVGGRSGYFDGKNDYVLVKSHYSLNITDAISIEGWIKPQELHPNVATFDTDAAFAYDPKIIHISDDIYAVVSGRGQVMQKAFLMTVEILSNGSVSFPSVSNNWIEITPSNKGFHPDSVHIADNCYLIAYSTKNSSNTPGLMKTINISDDGNLSNLSSEYTYSAVNGITPTLIKVSDDIFAVTYTGLDDDGFIKTINISSNGTINGVNDSLEFDTSNCYTPHIIRISNDIYAVVYRGSDKDGIIKTINITSDGNITDNIYNNTLIFESDKCYNPRITQVLDEHYAIVYSTGDETGSSEGVLVRVKIALNGTISRDVEMLTDHIGDQSKNKFFEPDIIQISPMLTVVIYRESVPHSGLISVFMTGHDLIPLSERGIVKSGAASLYANTTRVYASINGLDQMISLPITPNSWNHVVLTYDKRMIRLYCNFDGDKTPGIDYANKTYDQDINTSNKNLYFGYYFCGFIDEIGIFDHALEDGEITGHKTCIGCYEVQ